MEGVQVSKGVKNGVRGFLGIERSLGDPRGSRGVRGVVKVSQGMKRGVRDVPGVKGSQGDPKELRGTSGEY